MKYKTMLIAGFKRHKAGLLGVFVLVFIACLSLSTALAILINSSAYIKSEMDRMGFGDLTAWILNTPNISVLTEQIANQASVEQIGTQPLIYASYNMNGQDSDSEGQLIAYHPEQYPYKIFTDNLLAHRKDAVAISKGEIYLSPSMMSIFDAKQGDEIRFLVARSGIDKVFTVKGYFEDPFMGSSMIGMKSFLINEGEFSEISQTIKSAGIDSLARIGAMVHIFQSNDSSQSISEWNGILNETTSLSQFTEFTHSKSAMADFMLLLQTIFTGFLLVFVVILLIVCMIILGHSISSAIQRDTVDMGILKGLGFTSKILRRLQLIQYLTVILAGMLGSLIVAMPLISITNQITFTTTGILVPSRLPIGICVIVFAVILSLLCSFISIKTTQIGRICPLNAIRGVDVVASDTSTKFIIHKKGLHFNMALRQLISSKKQYLSVLAIAVLLVFLASMVGRVNSWLGADGKGLMEAFNPANHDIGVQRFGQLDWDKIDNTILQYTDITDQYLLAMQGVTVNDVDYTANVIDEPGRFHILKGRTCIADNEVVITEVAAADLNVGVGDTIVVSGGDYIISGIYQCANDMGSNIGMNRAGYAKIGQDNEDIWCTHYFIEDAGQKGKIIQSLTDSFGGDVHIHENGWPGLYGIINAMKVLMTSMYVIIAMVIFVVIMMISGKIIAMERRNLGIYKAIGFTDIILRRAFALRLTVAAVLGSFIGLLLSSLLTNPVVSLVMKQYGVSNFSSKLSLQSGILPILVVTILFAVFGFIASAKISSVNISTLVTE